jgi:hypothetical protein
VWQQEGGGPAGSTLTSTKVVNSAGLSSPGKADVDSKVFSSLRKADSTTQGSLKNFPFLEKQDISSHRIWSVPQQATQF